MPKKGMDIAAKNFGLMTLLMMGIIFFYFHRQNVFGLALVKTVVLTTIESVVISMVVIMAFTWFWNHAIAVEEAA